MTRVIFSPDIFSLQRTGGISRYICELAGRVPNSNVSVKVVAGIHLNRHLRQLSNPAGVYIPKLGPLGNYRLQLNQILFQRAATRVPDSVVHSTYYSNREIPKSHPVVLTVHDMIDELMPELSQAVAPGIKKGHCERADHIIAVSSTTKNDLIRLFGTSPDKITVVHHGDSLETLNPDNLENRTGNYLLYVGVRKTYKNFLPFVRAFASSTFLRSTFEIIAFGGGAFSEEEQKAVSDLKLDAEIRQVGGDDSALASYYRNASAFVFPSLYEGFGLPVLEAMGQSCPVICSDAGSLREVADNAAAYFDPVDTDQMRHVMEETLSKPELLAELRERGLARHSLFSWEKCAKQTRSVYESVLAQHLHPGRSHLSPTPS